MKFRWILALFAFLTVIFVVPSTFAQEASPFEHTKPRFADDPLFGPEIERIPLNRVLPYKSGNRDANWDWTANVTYTLQSTAGAFNNVRLPYYASSGPAAALLNDSAGRDIEPEDGWELVLRDFGPGVVIPYYILYNKYRGVMRLFYYSTLPQSFSRAIARMSFQAQTTSRSGAHFTFLDENSYVSSYDPARSQVVVGSVAFQQWAFFDFDVSGYDPGIGSKNDPTFVIEIAGVNQTDLTATGVVDLTTGPVSAAKSGSGFNIAGAFKNVKKRHKDVKNFKTEITNLANSSGSAWWAGPIKAIKSLTEKSWFGALGPVAGFLEFAIGGGSRKSTLPAPLSTKGTVELNGTLTTETALYTLIMRVPGSNHLTPTTDAASNVLPLYDDPLGVLNVSAPPAYTGVLTTDSTQLLPTGPWNISATTSATTPLQVVYNTAVFSSASVTATWAPLSHPAYGYRLLSSFNSGWSYSFSGGAADEYLYVDLFSGAYFMRLGIRARLTPRDGAPGLEPVTVYKAYDAFTNITLQYDPPSFVGGGLPGGEFLVLGDSELCGLTCAIAPTKELRDAVKRELQAAQLQRATAWPTTVDEHIADYQLALLLELEAHDEPGSALEAVRTAYRDRLYLLSEDGASWPESDLRVLESLALRALADRADSSFTPVR